jgi:hypothetical protein
MIDPSKLIAGATAVYGAAEIAKSYGQIQPVPARRVVQVHDGEQIELAGRALERYQTFPRNGPQRLLREETRHDQRHRQRRRRYR